MKTIQEKYDLYRPVAKDGDILLWHGNKIMARTIRFFDTNYINRAGEKVKDPAYYTHSSIAMWGRGNRLQNADSWSRGVTVLPMSDRINFYLDFCVLRPKLELIDPLNTGVIERGIEFIMDKWQAHVKYDYWTLPRVALIKKTGIDITGFGKKSHFICSEFTQAFCAEIGIKDYENLPIFTPQDHLRFHAGSLELLFDNKLIK